jgi:ferritin heavy chain
MTGITFEPFQAVAGELAVVARAPVSASYARTDFHEECEAAINEQIKCAAPPPCRPAPPRSRAAALRSNAPTHPAPNTHRSVEYTISYVYHSLYAYFSRDNVGLPGMAAHFKAESVEERHHAELLMDYQALRGGRVALAPIMAPEAEFAHAEKGDALYAFELALSLEKLNFQVRQEERGEGRWRRLGWRGAVALLRAR